jgi:hypothetical protein
MTDEDMKDDTGLSLLTGFVNLIGFGQSRYLVFDLILLNNNSSMSVSIAPHQVIGKY